MIYIQTTAYNASKTLARAADSILNQTYGQFEYYLIDNGSTDNGETRKIVEKYARQDARVKPFFNQKNHVWDINKEVIYLPHNIGEEDYFCLLDADDEYSLTFLADMLAFMEQNQLDIAACGNDIVRAEDNVLLGKRVLHQTMILEGKRFESFFPIYHQFMRTVWGKLFKGKTLRNTVLDTTSPEMPKVYGNDTFFTMRAFRDARRAGILGKVLHRYYMSPKSTSYVFNPDRSNCDRILRRAMLDFLKPYGPVSKQNTDFINAVHANACKDSLSVILNAKMSALAKMKWIRELLVGEGTAEIFQSASPMVMELAAQIRQMVLGWIRSPNGCESVRGAELSAEIAALLLPDHEVFSFLWNLRRDRPGLVKKLEKGKWLEHHLLTESVFRGVSMTLAFSLPEMVGLMMQRNYEQAWKQFVIKNDIEIATEDEEAYYLMGQNLAALAGDTNGFIYLKKVWIEYLIVHGQIAKAEAELKEFENILPNDQDFVRLRERINTQ